jgi:hypothetical protein
MVRLSGERGGEAVADVLFGNYNPTGRLAISVPRHSGQLPVYYNYKPSNSTPVKQLRGFERVALQPGETKTVTIKLTSEDLQLLDIDLHWRVVPGDFEIMVGKSSADIPLQGILKVTP